MSNSGIKVVPEIPGLFKEIKLKKIHKFATFKISDDHLHIVQDTLADPCHTDCREDDEVCFNKLKDILKVDEPRYILYDFSFKKNGRLFNKLAFIFWCDDDCPVKKRMVYASTKDTIKKVFGGISVDFKASEKSDMDYMELADLVEKA